MSVEPLGSVEALSDTHELDQFDSGVAELDQWLRRSARVAAAGTADPVPVVLLARLAVGRTEQGRQLGGHLWSTP